MYFVGLKSMISRFNVKLLLCFLTLNVATAFETSANASLLPCKKDNEQESNSPYHEITDCHRKIRITVDLYNTQKTPEGLEYIYVKEVANFSTGIRMRLLNPIVIRLQQTQVVLAYPFKYLSAVNGRATEIIVNYETRKNYTGCDDTSSISPTCGIKHDRGSAVLYSEGFCCFCPEEAVNEKQTRGGQDCSLEVESDDFEKQRYKASAHCLNFNDVWYSVSALSDPIIIHDISLHVYNQRFLSNGSEVWVSLTHDEEFEIGYKNPFQFDENKTIVAMFYTNNPKNGTLLISSEGNRLLIPQPMPGVPIEKLPPAVKNGAPDYLLISKAVIDASGEYCNKGGISYAAFAKQPNRCEVAKDTCLKNQPLEFWDADDELRKSGKKGSYLLENYGVPYKTPIIIDKETKEHWLALEYYDNQHTVVTIEFNADNIVALTPGKRAQISVVVSASFEKKMEFFVKVANKDLSPATFEAQAVKCGYHVPDTPVQSKLVPPQMTEEFVLSTHPGDIQPVEPFDCTVVVSSSAYGNVATRVVTVKPLQRCICNMHCKCMCLFESLKCEPMSVKEFHAAGFRGSPSLPTSKPTSKSWIREHPLVFLFALLLLLLLIGFAKAIVGYSGRLKVAHFGLKSLIFRRRRIKRYYEPHLRKMEVTYDDEGYPIDPDTEHHAQVHSEEIIFLLNVFFFFVWPLKKLAECFQKKENDQEEDSDYEKDEQESNEEREPSETNEERELSETTEEQNFDTSDGDVWNSLHSVDLNTDDDREELPKESQERYNANRHEIAPKYSNSESDITELNNRPPSVERQDSSTRTQRLNSAVSESILEFVQSHHGELPEVTNELARWQKGTAKINAVKLKGRDN